MKLLVIDADYIISKNGIPTVRLYGKKVGGIDEGKDTVVHIRNFEPYLYTEGLEESKIYEIAKDYIKNIEIVQRYRPIGYQEQPAEMLKITLFNPKTTPTVRKLVENNGGMVYEADILFKNRYLIDSGISGMSIINFDETDKELANYGLSCENLYIVNKEDITITKEIVQIEY